MSNDAADKTIDPAAVAPASLAQLLAKVGGQAISEGMIRNDLAKDAPANADGTLNIVNYAAWLVRELIRGE